MSRNKKGIALLIEDEADCEDFEEIKEQLSSENKNEEDLKKLSGFIEFGFSKNDEEKVHNLIMKEIEKDEKFLEELERRKKFPPKIYNVSKTKEASSCLAINKQPENMTVRIEEFKHSRLLKLMCQEKDLNLLKPANNSKSNNLEELGVASKAKMSEYLEMIENDKRKEAHINSSTYKKALEKKLSHNNQIIKKLSINLNDSEHIDKNSNALIRSIVYDDEDPIYGNQRGFNIIRGMWLVSQQNSLLNYRKTNSTVKKEGLPKPRSKRVKATMLFSIFHNTQQGKAIKVKSDLISRGDLLKKFAKRNDDSVL